MPEVLAVAAWLLVIGPVVGAFGFFDTALYRVWTAPRSEHLAIVAAHRRGWHGVNAAFQVATITTAVGLAVLAVSMDLAPVPRVAFVGGAIAYLVGGILWCTVVAIRDRVTPLLADLEASGRPTEPAESLLGAATGGLFASFSLLTGVSIVLLGIASAAGLAVPFVGGLMAIVGAGVIAWYLRAGDIIPAVVYLPTMLLGVGLLIGGVS